ncbi:MAG: hypothetical protein PHX13_04170 [Thiovulaceae bacterium]|nr:hypothetical protein [Sulfurimonadaceae bacterium]
MNGFSTCLIEGSRNFFDWVDFFTAAFVSPVGGFSISIFVGHIMLKSQVEKVLRPQVGHAFYIWYFDIVSVSLVIVMLNLVGVIG